MNFAIYSYGKLGGRILKTYRSDIDGLRAVAVVPVVLFHCGFSRFFPGGFVGVDIFFVISGFLITGIIDRQISTGSFSVADFYRRRVLRIFPALYIVYATILAASFLILMPSETASVTKNILSSILFVSNIAFQQSAGYFDSSNETNPLLHTWSLSIEEQFYIVLPLILMATGGFRRLFRIGLLSVFAVVSLAAAEIVVRESQSEAFYLLQFRAWELLAGSLLAIAAPKLAIPGPVANVCSIAGAALIAGSVLLLSSGSVFPGFSAVPACAGAVLILAAGMRDQTAVGRVLSLWPIRFVGLVSYSLYLWHWPVWVLGRFVYEPKSYVQFSFFVVVSFVLAVLSWRFIERPFRSGEFQSQKKVIGTGIGAIALASLVSMLLPISAYSYWHVSENIEAVAKFSTYDAGPSFRTGTCFLTLDAKDHSAFDPQRCLAMSSDKTNVLLLGDSHAAHLYAGLAADTSINVLQATASGCKPLIDNGGNEKCVALFSGIVQQFLPTHKIDVVVVSARWAEKDIKPLVETIAVLSKSTPSVVIVGPMIEYDRSLPRILAGAMYQDDNSLILSHRKAEPESLDRMLETALSSTKSRYISVFKTLCDSHACAVWAKDNVPLQFDYGHLTAEGSVYLLSKMHDAIHAP
jgi:peptidoglycan/LPS O-acetylase OafA/YrhL